MATPKKQRIGIWIIAAVMLVGTIGSFVVMVLANENNQKDLAEQQKYYDEYMKQLEEQQKKDDAAAKGLSDKYYATFAKYGSMPAAFEESSVGDTVTTKDLKPGDGAEIKEDTKYKAYYVGWTPKGAVFDSSIQDGALKAPIDTSQMSLIEGWNQGVVGMKVGGVREITIPSDLAYGEEGSGENIGPNTPIKFIVMIIETVEVAEE
jgi:FKBP-type peptidyl-prolyl cis-trans isomerase